MTESVTCAHMMISALTHCQPLMNIVWNVIKSCLVLCYRDFNFISIKFYYWFLCTLV